MSLYSTLLLIMALIGTPLFIVIAGFAAIAFTRADIDVSVIIIEMTRLSETPLLVSLPLFIFTGVLLSESGTPRRILRLSRLLAGRLPGGVAIIGIIVCALFTAFTGATGITIFALGGLLLPALLEENYSRRFSMGLITSTGSLGLLFPPSLPIIIYGVISGSRIDHLFLAGIIPGVIMLVLFAIYAIVQNQHTNKRKPASPAEVLSTFRECFWEIPLPLIIIGGIYGGIFTAGEAAAIGAFYAVIVEVFIYRDVSLTELRQVMSRSMVLFGGILVVLAASMATTNYFIDQRVPEYLFSLLQQWVSSKYTFLILLNIFLLAVGTLLDIFSALVLIVPLILPIATSYGIDPVHLGIIFLTNLQIGYCTPPVGLNLFLASYRFNTPIIELYRACLPFLGLLIIALIIITYLPSLCLLPVHWLSP